MFDARLGATASWIGVDLFCGAGGMSLGFEQAGIHVAGAIDYDEINVVTHSVNLPSCEAIAADLSKLSGNAIRRLAGIGDRAIDVVFGGPPCQGFSVGGKRDLCDPRNNLIFEFARIVRELRPSYFVMENVYGLLGVAFEEKVASLLSRLERAGYDIVQPVRTLDARSYGVPQRRTRAFVLGYRRGLPPPTYPAPLKESPTVWDAIGDISTVDGNSRSVAWDTYSGPLGRPSTYARELRDDPDARTGIITGFLRTEHSMAVTRRFARTKPGDTEPVSRFIRLSQSGVSSTIRSGTGIENGSFMAPRPIHPTRSRCIYVREAARLHSYPDWYEFHPTKWHAFRQIGNSVPPRLARAVAAEILKALRQESANGKEAIAA